MPKNLLFVSHTENLSGGGAVSLLELLKSAKQRGYGVHVVVPSGGEFSDAAKLNGFDHKVIEYSRWWSSPDERSKLANLASIQKIADYADQASIDCIITNTLTIPWGALAAAVADTPHVWTVREMLTHERESYQPIYEFVKAYSNLVIANSKANATFLKKQGIKAAQFHSYVDTSRIKLDPSHEVPNIVCIGIIHQDKNQLEVIEAVSKIDKLKYGKAIFFGAYREDDYFKQLQTAVKKYGLENKVEFAGYVKNPYGQIAANDILVQPSKQESLGRTITEAMKLGLITVASDIPGLKEALSMGGGVSYKLGDAKDLASKLEDILHISTDKYKTLADKSKQKALRNMSEQASHQPFFDAIQKVLNQPNPRRELRHLRRQLAGLPRIERQLNQAKAEPAQSTPMRITLQAQAKRFAGVGRKAKTLSKRLTLTHKPRPIHVIYIESRQFSGATVMRGQQLTEMAQKYVKGRQIDYRPLDLDIKNSVLFLTKWSLAALKPEYLDKLKAGGNTLLFDPVDAVLPDFSKNYADIVVAASHTAEEDYKKQVGERVFLVNHHVDPRVKFDSTRQPQNFRAAYFGELVNTYSTPKIEKLVDFVQVSTSEQVTDWFDKLSDYNLHYAVRHFDNEHSATDNHKPFLKGFTAAHCHSNILIQDDQREAITWLGIDYPYLIRGEPTEKKILDKLAHIKQTIGSSEWKRAMQIMEGIRQQTSEEAIGKQLKELFEKVR